MKFLDNAPGACDTLNMINDFVLNENIFVFYIKNGINVNIYHQ